MLKNLSKTLIICSLLILGTKNDLDLAQSILVTRPLGGESGDDFLSTGFGIEPNSKCEHSPKDLLYFSLHLKKYVPIN